MYLFSTIIEIMVDHLHDAKVDSWGCYLSHIVLIHLPLGLLILVKFIFNHSWIQKCEYNCHKNILRLFILEKIVLARPMVFFPSQKGPLEFLSWGLYQKQSAWKYSIQHQTILFDQILRFFYCDLLKAFLVARICF